MTNNPTAEQKRLSSATLIASRDIIKLMWKPRDAEAQ